MELKSHLNLATALHTPDHNHLQSRHSQCYADLLRCEHFRLNRSRKETEKDRIKIKKKKKTEKIIWCKFNT